MQVCGVVVSEAGGDSMGGVVGEVCGGGRCVEGRWEICGGEGRWEMYVGEGRGTDYFTFPSRA